MGGGAVMVGVAVMVDGVVIVGGWGPWPPGGHTAAWGMSWVPLWVGLLEGFHERLAWHSLLFLVHL